ncbi:serine/threonine-protein kinase [Streptomyces sp. NPDC052101]|uniref:serine/threonine-protein kinase n=1 Tax=Streptomyces sp. NPDC052101 TaxID=3155763 RepID=UPI0034459A9B
MDALRPQDPSHIGMHALVARLGAGGMGQVYLGRSPGGRLVAIKVIRDEITDHPDALARFRREVETARTVRSAYTANLIDASLDAAPYWLATEYVAGPTLAQAVAERGAPPAETCRALFAALAEGLAAVHAHGVTHRDLKPQNVILAAQGPQLIDFGIARGVGQTALTEAGFTAGTPGFTAPEVLMRNEVGPAADVFALGATVAYAATGRAPFGNGDPAGVSYRAVHEPIDLAGVEPGLAALIGACVDKDPAARPGLTDVIARCGVRTALVEDTFYRGLAPLGEAVPQTPPSAPPLGPHDLPTASSPHGGYGYTPTQWAAPSTAQPARRRPAPWMIAVAVGLVVGVGTATTLLLLPGGGGDGGGRKTGGAARPGATSAAPIASGSSAAGGGGSGTGTPGYVQPTNPSHDHWANGACNLAPDERNQFLQYSVTPMDGGESYLSGRLKLNVRLKFATPKPGEAYYVSVAVKPPHPIDPDTGAALENSAEGNVDLGFTSRPIDMYKLYSDGKSNGATSLTYPDDFHAYANGTKYQDAFPVAKALGNWTVIFLHVTKPKEYATIGCDGFLAK